MLVLRPRLPKSLRGTITMGLGFVGCLALVAAVLLLTLTNRLLTAGEEVAASIRSLRLIDEAEVVLLLHARSDDATVASAHESDLRHRLAAANASVTSPAERELLLRATEAVDRYLTLSQIQSAEAAAALSVAFGALVALTEVNLEQWSEAAERARKASAVAYTAGIATMLVVVPLVCLLVWWIWRRAFAPLVSLGQTMERFAAGERCARARPGGPRELEAMAERFNEMADELSRQKEAQMTFLAGIAHDLRNPLSPLKTCAVLLADGAASSTGYDTAGLARIIGRQVDQLDQIVGDLAEVSYMEAGHLELRLEKVDMLQVAGDVMELFRPVAPRHQLRLHSPQGTVWLTCDPVRVQRVLNNLVRNAIKYSPDGGAVTVTLDQDGAHVAISVSDSGPGIPLRDQPRLFEPFHRAPRAVKSDIPGAGLGLFISRGIVEAHGGTLVVNSGQGQGSTFVMRFPVSVKGQEAMEPPRIAIAAVH